MGLCRNIWHIHNENSVHLILCRQDTLVNHSVMVLILYTYCILSRKEMNSLRFSWQAISKESWKKNVNRNPVLEAFMHWAESKTIEQHLLRSLRDVAIPQGCGYSMPAFSKDHFSRINHFLLFQFLQGLSKPFMISPIGKRSLFFQTGLQSTESSQPHPFLTKSHLPNNEGRAHFQCPKADPTSFSVKVSPWAPAACRIFRSGSLGRTWKNKPQNLVWMTQSSERKPRDTWAWCHSQQTQVTKTQQAQSWQARAQLEVMGSTACLRLTCWRLGFLFTRNLHRQLALKALITHTVPLTLMSFILGGKTGNSDPWYVWSPEQLLTKCSESSTQEQWWCIHIATSRAACLNFLN